jgi:intracellular sulfur oxidation DsrE/DsrF family protein
MNKRFEELVKGMEKLVREGLDLKICFNSLRKNRVDEDDAWKIINNVIHNIISTSFKPKKEEA